MIKYRSIFNDEDFPEVPSPEFPKTVEHFSEIVLPDGSTQRTKVEDFPFYDMIQSFEKDSNISAVIRRAQQGDVSVLSSRQGFYLDLSGCPSDPFEAAEYFKNLSEMLKKPQTAPAEAAPVQEKEVKLDEQKQ